MTIELSVLRTGSSGATVKTLQRLLKSYGYKGKDGKDLCIDGSFGSNTYYALKNYQKKNGLEADGVCGKKSWNKLMIGK